MKLLRHFVIKYILNKLINLAVFLKKAKILLRIYKLNDF